MDKLIPLHEAAHRCQVSENTFRRWIKDGIVPAYRKGAAQSTDHETRPIWILADDLPNLTHRIT